MCRRLVVPPLRWPCRPEGRLTLRENKFGSSKVLAKPPKSESRSCTPWHYATMRKAEPSSKNLSPPRCLLSVFDVIVASTSGIRAPFCSTPRSRVPTPPREALGSRRLPLRLAPRRPDPLAVGPFWTPERGGPDLGTGARWLVLVTAIAPSSGEPHCKPSDSRTSLPRRRWEACYRLHRR